jgi:hypothetical protein
MGRGVPLRRPNYGSLRAEKFSSDPLTVAPPAVSDAEIFVEMIGLQNIEKVNELRLTIQRSSGFKNAAACFLKGSRRIIYDPDWARTSTAEFYLVLGHEAGHHFCGHTAENVQISPKERELDADRFSGASIKRFEAYHGKAFLQDALKAANRLYSEEERRPHSARAARVEAVLAGYNSGSTCASLAPGIRGYSSEPR